jgi:hypothetical protein
VFIINDTTPMDKIIHPKYARGLRLPPVPRGGRRYEGTAMPFPQELIIPRSEWQARIQEKNEQKSWMYDLMLSNGVKIKNQKQINYCWIFANTLAAELIRVKQGEIHVPLSPASAGAQITNYRNVGGYGKQALDWGSSRGWYPSSEWPDTAISRQYKTAEGDSKAMLYRVDEWWECSPRSYDEAVSAILQDFPCGVGYNWWSHEVLWVKLEWLDGVAWPRIANSWGEEYGENGTAVLQGNRAVPDDCVCPCSTIAA